MRPDLGRTPNTFAYGTTVAAALRDGHSANIRSIADQCADGGAHCDGPGPAAIRGHDPDAQADEFPARWHQCCRAR